MSVGIRIWQAAVTAGGSRLAPSVELASRWGSVYSNHVNAAQWEGGVQWLLTNSCRLFSLDYDRRSPCHRAWPSDCAARGLCNDRGDVGECMSVLSLNLDFADAVVVRSALRFALAACSCASALGRSRCGECEAMMAISEQLDAKIDRPATGRVPVLSLVALEGAGGSPDDGVSDPAMPTVERLRLIVRNQSGTGIPG